MVREDKKHQYIDWLKSYYHNNLLKSTIEEILSSDFVSNSEANASEFETKCEENSTICFDSETVKDLIFYI